MRKIFSLVVLGFMVCSACLTVGTVNAQVCFNSSRTSPFAVGTAPYSVTSADFNGDGKADLAVANNISNNVYYLMYLLHLLPLMR